MEKFTKYEKARMIGSRALQISDGAPFIVVLPDDELENLKFDPFRIAEIEFERGVIPITIKRPLPHMRQQNTENAAG